MATIEPLIVYFIRILFKEPKLSIVEGEEKFIEAGSNLNLTCIIRRVSSKEDPKNFSLKWTHNDQV